MPSAISSVLKRGTPRQAKLPRMTWRMPFRNPATVQFGLRVALPAILVVCGTIAVVLVALDKMANEVNRTEEMVTARSVGAALASTMRRLGQSHKDYASWD